MSRLPTVPTAEQRWKREELIMSRFIREEDVYKLFGQDGTARLHVGDIDVLPRVELREAGGQVECVGADDLVAKMKKLHPYFAISYLGFDALEHDDQIRVEQIARCIAEVARAPRVDPSKPIRARWKAFVFDEAQLPVYVCSHCGGAVKAGDDRDWCPSCGARMDLSVKEDVR